MIFFLFYCFLEFDIHRFQSETGFKLESWFWNNLLEIPKQTQELPEMFKNFHKFSKHFQKNTGIFKTPLKLLKILRNSQKIRKIPKNIISK